MNIVLTNDVRRTRLVVASLLICTLALAGCLSGPVLGGEQGQQGPVSVNVTNVASETHEFEIFVLEGPPEERTVTVQDRIRGSHNGTMTEGLSTYALDNRNVTAIEFAPNRTRPHDTVTLAQNETATSQIDEFETSDLVVVLVSHDDRVVSMVSATCADGDLVALGVTMRSYGTDSGINCQ